MPGWLTPASFLVAGIVDLFIMSNLQRVFIAAAAVVVRDIFIGFGPGVLSWNCSG
jgi:hypothetical protein